MRSSMDSCDNAAATPESAGRLGSALVVSFPRLVNREGVGDWEMTRQASAINDGKEMRHCCERESRNSLEEHDVAVGFAGALHLHSPHADIAHDAQVIAGLELAQIPAFSCSAMKGFRRLPACLYIDVDPALDQAGILAAETVAPGWRRDRPPRRSRGRAPANRPIWE